MLQLLFGFFNDVMKGEISAYTLNPHFVLRVQKVGGGSISSHVSLSGKDFISTSIASIHLAESGLLKLTASWYF